MTNRQSFKNFKLIITECGKSLLPSVTGITECDKKLLQIVTGVAMCGNYYKVRCNKVSICNNTVINIFKKFIAHDALLAITKILPGWPKISNHFLRE